LDIQVTTNSGGTGGPDCTLRDAITAANQDAPSGGCPAGSGADTILLAAPLYSLSEVDNVTDGPNGLPSIVTAIIIEGAGAAIERLAGAPNFRIFHVGAAGDLRLRSVTVRNGRAPDGVTGNPGGPGIDGGGIFNAGTLDLETSTVTANMSGNGGVGEHAANGGAGGNGGGIYNTGNLSIVRSTVDHNRAGDGGSQFGDGGNGGGIGNVGGDVRLINSTVSGNVAGHSSCTGHVGGKSGDGGGLYQVGGSTTVANATIVANQVQGGCGPASLLPGRGGGIFTGAVSPLLIGNSIVAENVIVFPGGPVPYDCYTDTDLQSRGYNLFGSGIASCAIGGDTTGNQLAQDPRVGPLQNNGGPTETHALLPGSPAIDAGTPQPDGGCTDLAGTALTTDQRGEPRPQGPRCDIGAFEATPTPTRAPLLGTGGLIGSMLMLLCLGWHGLQRRRVVRRGYIPIKEHRVEPE
jgi:hypothetical protein